MEQANELQKLKKVSQIETANDIRQLSHAQFPGTHCPLFGVALTAGYVKDLAVLVVGTDECTYYTKTFNMNRRSTDLAMEDNFMSFAINQDDVVFGCQSKVEKAVIDMDKTMKPKAILLVTTCVLEVIGEDFEAVVFNIQDQVNAKLLVVHTEHFKCNSHIPGIERTLTALKDLMREQAVVPGTVNILGHRYEGVEKTELLQLLKSKGITVNLVIPSSCGVDDLKSAPSAALNIVTDFTALPLADAMKIEYGTDYVYFDRYLSPMRIESAYNDISQKLNIDLSKEVSVLKDELNRVILEHSFSFSSKRFIYGNTPMLAFEVSGFLSSLGMEPILVQARDLYANDHKYMKEILDLGWDPYVSRIANIAPLQLLYGQLKPDIYVGHENPRRLAEQGITQVVLDSAASKLGFEVPSAVVRTIAKSLVASKSMDRRHGHRAAN